MNTAHPRWLLLVGLATLLLTAVVGPAGTQAQAVTEKTVSTRVEINDVAINDCTGETLTVSGYAMFNDHFTFDANGGLHIVSHFTAQNVTAIGETTGTRYKFPGGSTFILNSTTGEVSQDVEVGSHLVGPGPDNNMLYIIRFHYTVNAQGEVTALFDRFELRCNG